MKNIPVKYQVTFGLICLLVSIMSLAGATGIAPDERGAILRGRGQLCSALAINSSIMINKRDTSTLEKMLEAVVERDDDIISAALRTRAGRIKVSAGEHKDVWDETTSQSVETQIAVPLNLGKQKWGQLEICFRPAFSDRMTAAWVSPKYLYLALVSVMCVVGFAYYLGKVLKQLDPSNAVPRHVEDALNTLTEGLILTDAKGKVRLANDAFTKWIGCDSRKLIGVDPTALPWERANANSGTAWDDAATQVRKIVVPWDKALRSGRPVSGSLLRLPNQQGRMMTLIANSSPIVGAKGEYVGVLTSFEDVTDLENHKRELSRAKENADEANRAKSDFLARMSHEIRTPMNAILGYAEVLRENLEEDPATRQQHLCTIHNSGEHLLALINDILDLSKIESGQMTLERTPVSIFDIMNDVESVLKIKSEEKGIYLQFVYGNHMPQKVKTDSVRLRQSIINLVGNAIKFTDQGGVTVYTEFMPGKRNSMLSIEVRDTGIGMSQQATDKIFQPFSQADTSITRRFGGTGLGLAICKELAEKMGGRISVESQPGRGSTFKLKIDIGNVSDEPLVSAQDAKVLSQAQINTDSVVQLPPMRVLIVDDGKTNRQLVSVYLRKANVEFDCAENGQVAVEKVNSGNFDVVLMDMHMPIMDGFEATRALRTQGHRLPIIALTANAMAEDKLNCSNAGCSAFLAKPINRDRLYTALSMAVTGSVIRTEVPTETTIEPTVEASPTDSAGSILIPQSTLESETAPMIEAKQIIEDNTTPIGSTLPMDDEDFVYVAELFVASLHKKTGKMVESLASQDFDQLFELGHWLAGAGSSAGYAPLRNPGAALELAAKDQDLAACLAMIQEICKLASRVHVDSSLNGNSLQ